MSGLGPKPIKKSLRSSSELELIKLILDEDKELKRVIPLSKKLRKNKLRQPKNRKINFKSQYLKIFKTIILNFYLTIIVFKVRVILPAKISPPTSPNKAIPIFSF